MRRNDKKPRCCKLTRHQYLVSQTERSPSNNSKFRHHLKHHKHQPVTPFRPLRSRKLWITNPPIPTVTHAINSNSHLILLEGYYSHHSREVTGIAMHLTWLSSREVLFTNLLKTYLSWTQQRLEKDVDKISFPLKEVQRIHFYKEMKKMT